MTTEFSNKLREAIGFTVQSVRAVNVLLLILPPKGLLKVSREWPAPFEFTACKSPAEIAAALTLKDLKATRNCGAKTIAEITNNMLAAGLTPNWTWPERKKVSYRCFHCDAVFKNREDAQIHFGPSQRYTPACQIDAADVRRLEQQLAAYREEDTDLHRQIRRMETEHEMALRRAEEAGYARGLEDGRAQRI